MNPVTIIAINIETGETVEFPSVKEAAARLGIKDPSQIRMSIVRNGTCHGYTFKRGKAGLPPRMNTKTNICFDCKKACGGCSWSELDPVTGKPRFEPVPGWTAKPARLFYWGGNGTKRCFDETYEITACPLFEPDIREVNDGL